MTETPLDISQMLNVGIAATDRGEYENALRVFSAVYTKVPADKMPQGWSSYGLCLARVEGKRKLGAEMCQKAIQLQSYEGRHRANLVRVYITAKNRKKAVDVLDDSLRRLRNDPELGTRARETVVKIAAPVQPVPPAAEVCPVEFDGLTVTPYVNDKGRIAFSYRATGMRAPAAGGRGRGVEAEGKAA